MNRTQNWRRVALGAGLTALVLAPVISLSCTTVEDVWPDAGAKPKVLTSFAPLYCFTLNVAGEDAAVKPLLTNRGPHDYPYDPHDLLPLRKANLFLVNGLGLDEDFSNKLAKNAGNSKLKLIKVAEAAVPKEDRPRLDVRHDDHEHHGDDPHVWLGLPEAMKIVEQIGKELGEIDPPHKQQYEDRAKAYKAKLQKLLDYGKAALSGKPDEQRIITTHDAFQYFARSFNVEIVGFIQPRAGKGIDSKDLKELVDKCRSKDKPVEVITTEPQFPTNDAETLLHEVSSKLQDQKKPVLAEIDPLETADPNDLIGHPEWYEQKMKKNIDTLVEAFKKYREQK